MDLKKARTKFDRLIVLLNPASTNYGHAKKYTAAIERMFPANMTVVLQTSPDGKESTAAILREHAGKFGPRTLLCIVAGDGTVNFVINMLLTDKKLPQNARSTVILPLWGGNGNDMSTMLNGKPRASKIKAILDNGNLVTIHPLYCRITAAKQESDLILAGNCIGFGASGKMCMQLNSPAHRKGKLMRVPGGKLPQAIKSTWVSLAASTKFEIEESGARSTLFERTIFNGPVVARFYHQPIRLKDNHFYMDTWQQKVPVATPLSALLSFQRRTLRRSDNHYYKKTQFSVLQTIWVQFDGEPYKVFPDTKVEIGIFEQPFKALSTVIK